MVLVYGREAIMHSIAIKKLEDKEKIEESLSLAWKVFNEYEAPDYSQEGIDEFYRCIHDEEYLSTLRIFGAFAKDKPEDELAEGRLVGVIATRDKGSHIALFFVDGKYQRQGIGRKLFQTVLAESFNGKMTVNSSPYAVPVYYKLGFRHTDTEQIVNGIRFIPMKLNIISTEIQQFVMAYQVEQDRLRAMMPDGYESLRPVVRINVEIRSTSEAEADCRQEEPQSKQTVYIEVNTPVAASGKRGWLNIHNWESPDTEITCTVNENATTFECSFLKITYTAVGVEGGCPAERDNDGCFFYKKGMKFIPAERIDSNREFCDCEFRWKFDIKSTGGISVGGKSIPAAHTAQQKHYDRQELSARNTAAIPCQQILGAYTVKFQRYDSL